LKEEEVAAVVEWSTNSGRDDEMLVAEWTPPPLTAWPRCVLLVLRFV
jgi:hypothetical protein